MPSPASLSRVLGTTAPEVISSLPATAGVPPIQAAKSFTISGGFMIMIAKKNVNTAAIAILRLKRLALYSSEIEQ